MANVNGRYYGNNKGKKGATIPVMTRMSIEDYQELVKFSEATDLSINQVTLAFLEYALDNAHLEECIAHRISFSKPVINLKSDTVEDSEKEVS